MLGGKLAAYSNWSYIWATLSKSPDKYGMAAMPGSGIFTGGFWWAVSDKAPHPECARKLISWMLDDDFQTKQMLATGNPPATISVMNNSEATGKIPAFDAYLASADRTRIVDVAWARELGDGISTAMSDVASGKKTRRKPQTGCRTSSSRGGSRLNKADPRRNCGAALLAALAIHFPRDGISSCNPFERMSPAGRRDHY